MQVTIEIDNWPQAHYLGCILADAEWEFKRVATESLAAGGVVAKDPEIGAALERYARFFRRVAKQITSQASALNT
jgi:hypothetical protein